jgi:hypothetical protein
VKFWLILLVRVVLFAACGSTAFMWLLQAIQIDSSWAHPILGRVFCCGVSVLYVWLGVMGILNLWCWRRA